MKNSFDGTMEDKEIPQEQSGTWTNRNQNQSDQSKQDDIVYQNIINDGNQISQVSDTGIRLQQEQDIVEKIKIKTKDDKPSRFRSNLVQFKQPNQEDEEMIKSTKVNYNVIDNIEVKQDVEQNKQNVVERQNELGHYSGDEMEIPMNKEQLLEQEMQKQTKSLYSEQKQNAFLYSFGKPTQYNDDVDQFQQNRQQYQEQIIEENPFQNTNQNQDKGSLDLQAQNEITDQFWKLIKQQNFNQENQQNFEEAIQQQENVEESESIDDQNFNNQEYVQEDRNQIAEESQNNQQEQNKESSQISDCQDDDECLNADQILYKQLLDELLDIIKEHLFILDSIHRKDKYNEIYQKVWRYQINALTKFQRYQLYDQLKLMKQLLNNFKLFNTGFSLQIVKDQKNIWKITKQLIEQLKLDFQRLTGEIDFKIWEDFKRIVLDGDVLNFQYTQSYVRRLDKDQDKDIIKYIIDFTLKLIDFTKWDQGKVLSCKLCKLIDVTAEIFFKHMLEHLKFLHIFDSNMGRCADIKCKSKKKHKTHEFNLTQHNQDCHSSCQKIEKPLRYCVIQNEDQYTNNWRQYSNFENQLEKILHQINPQYANQYTQQYVQNNQKKADKQNYFRRKVREDIQQMNHYIEIEELEIFDKISIFLTTTWKYLFEDPLQILNEKIPMWVKQVFASRKLPLYNQQLKLIEVIFNGSQLESLKMKLILGYFNQPCTLEELQYIIRDFQDALQGIAIGNFILGGKIKRIAKQCIFNNILCQEDFDNREQALQHYFKAHRGIMACFANERCELDSNERVDIWIQHCHDFHKEDFVTFCKEFLQQQKTYFQFKAICPICDVKLQSLTEVFWKKNQGKILQQEWKVQIRVRWSDIMKSYNQEREIGETYMMNYKKSFENYKKTILEDMNTIFTRNNEGKESRCKKCFNNKVKQMPHLKKEQFENRDANKLFPLVKMEGRITKKGSDTFYRVIGNLNALKEKPHIFFEGTDIMYQWNSTQAKKHFKCKLMDRSKIERLDYVSACKNHTFLANHSYKLVDLSQQLIRQEKQILTVNKNLWLRHLDKENVSEAKDKLQLEFSKMQDMLLFDGLLHRTQIIFVCKNIKKTLLNLIRELKKFLQNPIVNNHALKANYENLNINERQFWEITMVNYLICEQSQDELLDFSGRREINSLTELLLLNREYNIFGQWIREQYTEKVRNFINYAIHPIYLGVYYQIAFKNFEAKNQLNESQTRLITGIFQTLCVLTIDTCLLNHGYTLPNQENTYFQQTKAELIRQEQYLLNEMLDMLDDQQFIDMQTRITLIETAIINFLEGKHIEDIIPSDLRWAIQMASIFLSSLKAQIHYFPPSQDRKTRQEHFDIIKGLKEEIEYFYARNSATYNQDFLTTDYRDIIQEIVDNDFFPKDELGNRKIRNYTDTEIKELSKYKQLKKLHIVFWIPVEDKLRNLLNVHKTLRELSDKEPYFQMSKQINMTTFHKELEYAMFPHLFPNAKGGLVTKAPDPQYYQLVVDLVEQDKQMAPYHLKQLKQIRQRVIQQKKDKNQIINSNDLEIEVQLIDFNVREQFGNTTYKPTKAIYKFLKQPIINSNQSMAFILELQQLAPLQYEQLRVQLEKSRNEEWQMPQVANVQILVNDNYTNQTILENHVSQNLDVYLKKNIQLWDNEQQQFINRQQQDVSELQRRGKSKDEVEAFLILQKKLFIETKIKQIGKENQLNFVLQNIRQQHVIQLDDHVSTSESEEEKNYTERANQLLKALDQINTFNRSILDSLQEFEQQQQQQQNQQQIRRKEIQELVDLDKQKVDLSIDTKFRLKCYFTENFQKDYKWILWRYYEWIKSQFYCYQKIVNKQKGVMVYQEGEMKKFTSVPPICGSQTELQEKYKELRAYCYQEGPPLLMLTVTSNEFDEKTFKIMNGLNFFDLEDEAKVSKAEKKITRQDDINDKVNLYVEYYIYLGDKLKKVIQNKYQNQQHPVMRKWETYSKGIFGDIKCIVRRIEFQERGSLHFHILLFHKTNEEGLYDEKLLLYLKGIISCLRMDKKKDKQLIEKYKLLHRCSANRCTKAEDLKCKEGYPFKQTMGYVNANYPVQIQQRRFTLQDSNVISSWKLLIKLFNSNVQVQITGDERIVQYIMKYINKTQTRQDSQNTTPERIQELDQQPEEKQLMDLIKQFYQDKITHVQEACLAFQQKSIIETTYKVIKINQYPFKRQAQNNANEIMNQLTLSNVEEIIQWKNTTNTWNRYMRRPIEFEYLNLIEYATHCINYARKNKYINKYNTERQNKQLQIQNYKYFLDMDGCVIKLKQLKEYKQTVIVKTIVHSTIDYDGENNIYYLEMLQLFWPHRYQEWMNMTRDEYIGYQEAYHSLIDIYNYPDVNLNNIASYFQNILCKFKNYPLKNYVMEHNEIKAHQKRYLEVMFKYKFNLQYGESNQNNLQKVDFIFQQKQLIRQLLDQEYGYWRVNQIKKILELFNPKITTVDENLINDANQLLEDLKNDVKDFWQELSQNTKNIISNLAQLYKHYGCSDIAEEIKKFTDKHIVSKSKAKGKELYQYQNQFIRQTQGQIQEDGQEMNKSITRQQQQKSQTAIIEEIPITKLLSERLEDFHIKYESHFKNQLTVEEYNKSKVQRKIKYWNVNLIDSEMKECYKNLNLQQRLAFIMMLINITMTFKENEYDRKFEGTFIHGPGGVGKSFIIATFIKFTETHKLCYDILCPTQCAAQNVILMCQRIGVKQPNAQTIHSFLKLQINQGIKSHMNALRTYLGKKGIFNYNNTSEIFQNILRFQFFNFQNLLETFRKIDVLIVEEVSMMDPDFLTILDIYGQITRQCSYPFGGIQVFLFGDSFQLQPVMQGKSNYFDSHVLRNSYFNHMIELTQSVRQAEDLHYFINILQPIRLGTFGEDANNFYQQIQKLQHRIIPATIFQPNQILGEELIKKQQQQQQVISLYFKNQNVEQENQRRALEIIKMIDEKRLKTRNTDKKRFRQYIKQPIQFKWSNQQTDDDKMILVLGQRFNFDKEIYDNNFTHQTHYLMLPIGIRNYVAKQLGEVTYRIAMKQGDINASICLKELTLFEKEEIIIRKNLDKSLNLINGQFGIIKDLIFDVDYKYPDNMRKDETEQYAYIKEKNYYNLLQEIKVKQIIRFTNQDKEEITKYLEQNNCLNINFLNEQDIYQSEKGFIYLSNVEPRLQKINIKLGEVNIASLEITDRAFHNSVNIQKGEFIRNLTEIKDSLIATQKHVEKIMTSTQLPAQKAKKIYDWLVQSQEIELFGIDILNGHFCLEYLEKSITHMKYLMSKLPNTCNVQISQIPINLGYARTIHCAQGSTFENIILDLDMPERQQSGLLYTALSRVRKMSNLYLNGRLDQNMFKVRVCQEIKQFYEDNILEVPKYLQDQELSDLLNKDFTDILENINLMSSDLRQALIQLKLNQMKVKNQ